MDGYKNTPAGRATAEKYKDIIDMKRPHSSRPHMDPVQRAKIFSPYDALRGFDEAIDTANRKTREAKRIYLSEEQKGILSDKLMQVRKGMLISAWYFIPEKNKNTGNYVTATGVVTRIDPVGRTLEIQEHAADTTGGKIEKMLPTLIRFDDLVNVESPEIKDTDEYLGIE